MDVKNFLYMYTMDRRKSITNELTDIIGLDWNLRDLLFEATEKIDYGCRFDANGLCYNYRKDEVNEQSYKCCCHSCYRFVGYLNYIRPIDIKQIAYKFKKDVGFWREGKGCVLPRKLRSNTCVKHHCHTELLNAKDRYLLTLLKSHQVKPLKNKHTKLDFDWQGEIDALKRVLDNSIRYATRVSKLDLFLETRSKHFIVR